MAETTHQFRAETCKLLNILTHSLYTNHEIFLRELLSNASDALEKVRFLQATGGEVRDPELPLEIRIATDKENHILTIADTGVGMSEQDLIDNLGTIARSGSEQFLRDRAAEQGDAAKDAELVDDKLPGDDGEEPIVEHDDSKTDDAAQIIGRFGIGFYSVFMVAKKVEVTVKLPSNVSKDLRLKEYIDGENSVASAISNLTTEISANMGSANSELTSATDEMASTLENSRDLNVRTMEMERDQLKTATDDTMTGMKNAITSGSPKLQSEMQKAMNDTVSAAKTVLGESGGRSQVFYNMGASMMTSLASGISSKGSAVSNAMQSALQNAIDSLDLSGFTAKINKALGAAMSK